MPGGPLPPRAANARGFAPTLGPRYPWTLGAAPARLSRVTVDAEALAVYRATVRRREADERAAAAAWRERALHTARAAAEELRARFGAARVVVFGSLVDHGGLYFDRRSDIDLAAWGIASESYFTAVAQMQDISPGFRIDLVSMERCPEHLRAAIEQRGVDL